MLPDNFAVNFCCCADAGLTKPDAANASTNNVAANAVLEIVFVLIVYNQIAAGYIQLCKSAVSNWKLEPPHSQASSLV